MTNIIRVGQDGFRGDSNVILQRAVDASFAAGGGTVVIPAGTYRMQNALSLRSGVDVVGEGRAVLEKIPSVTTMVKDYLGYGHYEFTVTEPEKLEIGMGVHLTDDRGGGFYDTVATITGRKGELFFMDRPLVHDCTSYSAGRVNTLFSLIDGHGVENVRVKNLVLDGNPKEERSLNGCRGGGVFLLDCHNVRIEGVEVLNYFGDAISFQQCTDVWVTGCHLHDNRGHGLHPGSGSVRYVIERNRVIGNQGHAVSYCLRTTHSRCIGNEFIGNEKDGVSIGERDTNHAILNNLIQGNGGAGICFREPGVRAGDGVLIRGNRLERNAQKEDKCEIAMGGRIHRVWMDGNSFAPGKGKALSVGAGCEQVHFFQNKVHDRTQTADDVHAESGSVSFTVPSGQLAVGPEAASVDSARHLNRPPLKPWSEGPTNGL